VPLQLAQPLSNFLKHNPTLCHPERSRGTCCAPFPLTTPRVLYLPTPRLLLAWIKTKKGRGFRPGLFARRTLVAEEQDASGLVFSHFAYRPVEELIVVEIYLEERRTLGNAAGDQCFR
jgi:hypothetical protein